MEMQPLALKLCDQWKSSDIKYVSSMTDCCQKVRNSFGPSAQLLEGRPPVLWLREQLRSGSWCKYEGRECLHDLGHNPAYGRNAEALKSTYPSSYSTSLSNDRL